MTDEERARAIAAIMCGAGGCRPDAACQCADAITTALAAARAEALEWQPIETAPKDSRSVLTWDGRRRAIARYEGATEFMLWDWMAQCFAEEAAPAAMIDPTHWMPLPAPPRPE